MRKAMYLWLTASGLCTALLLCGLPPLSQPVSAEEKAADSGSARFMRVTFDDKDLPVSMDTAIVRYVSADNTRPDLMVDLIGAVHVGDQSYYDQLNTEFEGYDSLLYELVAPRGTKIPKGGIKGAGTGSAVSQLQLLMKRVLALEFQLEQVDYTKDNFVHADMTPEQFSKSMKNLKEDPMVMFLRLMKASSEHQAKNKRPPPNDLVIMAAFFDRKRGPAILKRIFAEQLSDADVLLEALNGPQGSTLITERNKVALDVLAAEIDAGKKRLGIFYGAAHLADMETRLVERFKLKRKETKWIRAWDLKSPPKEAPKVEKPASDKPAGEKPAAEKPEAKAEKTAK